MDNQRTTNGDQPQGDGSGDHMRAGQVGHEGNDDPAPHGAADQASSQDSSTHTGFPGYPIEYDLLSTGEREPDRSQSKRRRHPTQDIGGGRPADARIRNSCHESAQRTDRAEATYRSPRASSDLRAE